MKRWIIVIIAAAVVGGATVFFLSGGPTELPELDTSGLETAVKEKLVRLRARAREEPDYNRLMHYGRALQAHALNDDALAVYELAAKRGQKPFEAHYLIGILHARTDKNAAIAAFRKAIELKNNEPLAYLRLAMVLEESGESEAAKEMYERSIQIRGQPAAFLGVARTSLAMGDARKAVETLEYLIEISPRDAAIWSTYSQAVAQLGREQEARRAGDVARSLRPNPSGNIIDPYLRRVDSEGVSFSAVKWKANLASLEGKLRMALRIITAATVMEPTDPDARFERGVVLLQMKRYDEAIEDARLAQRLRPDWPKAIELEGTALGNAGRREEAEAVFEKALERFPDDAGLHSGLATAIFSSDPARSLEHFDRAVELAPSDSGSAYSRARLLANAGRTREALQQLIDMLRTAPKHADALILLASLYVHSSNTPEAKKVVLRLLKHHPGNSKGKEMLRALGG